MAGLVIADTREQVTRLNAAIRDHRLTISAASDGRVVTTAAGEQLGVGDRIATRRNDRDVGVANRDRWTITRVQADGGLHVLGPTGHRALPAGYVHQHVELAYATTAHGAQGETVHTAHLVVGESTGAAAAYVGMTRGRQRNIAHLVADTLDEAKEQWVQVFGRGRADLGPRHAKNTALEDIDRYGIALQRLALQPTASTDHPRHHPQKRDPYYPGRTSPDAPGIGR